MNERRLVARAKHGDEAAFASLVRKYLRSFYGLAFSILRNESDANDAVQEAVIAMWTCLPQLRNTHAFRSWALRIVANKSKTRLHARRDIPNADLPDDISALVSENRVSHELEWRELIESLDSRYRAPMQLYYADGFSTREIAEILDEPKSTVTTYLQRGRKQARQFFARAGREA